MNSESILQLEDLSTHFPIYGGLLRKQIGAVQAVNRVTLEVQKGKTLGVVGESGCGKSTLGRTVCRLYDPTSGKIFFKGQDITGITGSPLKKVRRNIQMIFQDPYASLNPRMTILEILAEPYRLHNIGKRSDDKERVLNLMEKVGLRTDAIYRYPHEFSGGQRQRIGIARAISLEPELIVCDEAVSALDVSIQSQVLNLLVDLQQQMGLSYIFISHDLAVVRYISDHIAVMYLGEVVEYAERDTLFATPKHPYTQALLQSLPIPDPQQRREHLAISGEVPSPSNPPSGCRFHTRCPMAQDICRQKIPDYRDCGPKHKVACHFAESSAAH